MCMYDDGGGWKVYHEETRRAAKPHRCGECRRWIEKGESYEYVSGLGYDSDCWATFHTCAQCVQVKRWLLVACGGYMFEMTRDDIWNHIGGDEWYLRSAPLIRLFRWQTTGWRSPAGGLRHVDDVRPVVDRAIAIYARTEAKAVAA